jgi:phosphoglycolate phosphatase
MDLRCAWKDELRLTCIPHQKISAILFDKDGTLVDFDATFGPAGFDLLDRLSAGDAALFQRLADALHYDLARRRFLLSSPFIAEPTPIYGAIIADIVGRADRAVFFSEIDAALEELSVRSITAVGDPNLVLGSLAGNGIKLGIATNDTEYTARRQAERLGLSPHFNFYAGYDSGYGGKPGPGMILAFARHCGVTLAQVALVGDSLNDMLAARAAGCVAIAVLSGPAPLSVLAPYADYVINHIGDLPALLTTLPSAS